MTTGIIDQLVADYLARLAAAAATLPPDRRAELLAEIGEHISVARAAGAAADEPAVRTLLDRLGEPAEIVAAAGAEGPAADGWAAAPTPTAGRRQGVGLETAAVLLLTLGSLIPVLGWAVGALLLWSSPRWRRREKLLGTLVVPGGPGLFLWLANLAGQVCVGSGSSLDGAPIEETQTCTGFAFPPVIGIPLTVVVLVGQFIVGGLLLARARTRANQQPLDPQPSRLR